MSELVSNQGKLMDNLSKKLASNDKILENINNRMDNFSTTIKNQISFNKMIESCLNQIAAVVPATNPGIPSQSEGLEFANLVDMFDTGTTGVTPLQKLLLTFCWSREAIEDAPSSRSPSAWWTSQKHSATLALVSTLRPGYSMKNSLHILY